MAAFQGFCKHGPDSFCYVCGTFVSDKSVKHKIVEGNDICAAFYTYFGVQVGTKIKLGRRISSVETVDQLLRRGIEGKAGELNLERQESAMSVQTTWRTATFAWMW